MAHPNRNELVKSYGGSAMRLACSLLKPKTATTVPATSSALDVRWLAPTLSHRPGGGVAEAVSGGSPRQSLDSSGARNWPV